VSKETLRQILMEEGLHRAKKKKKGTAHPLRERRACRGELVQIDGSYHAWLKDRAEEACLLMQSCVRPILLILAVHKPFTPINSAFFVSMRPTVWTCHARTWHRDHLCQYTAS